MCSATLHEAPAFSGHLNLRLSHAAAVISRHCSCSTIYRARASGQQDAQIAPIGAPQLMKRSRCHGLTDRRIRLSSAGLGRLPNVTYGRLLPARCQRSDRRVGTGHPPALMVSSVRPAPAARRRARASPHAFASGLIRSGPGPQRRAASGRMGTCPWPLTSSTPRSRPIGPGTSSGSCRNTPTTPPWCSSTARRCSWARR
jgi:hypothetical protein